MHFRTAAVLVAVILLVTPLAGSRAASKDWVNPDLVPQQQSPQPPPAQPLQAPRVMTAAPGRIGLVTTRVCDYQPGYSDQGSGGQQDGAFYLPRVPPGYSMIGGYAQGNYAPPTDCVLAVRPDSRAGSEILLRPPRDWQLLWTDRNSGAYQDGSIWQPVPPGPDYVCLGSVARRGYGKPVLNNYACVHTCLVEYLPAATYIWSDRGTGAAQQVSVYKLHNTNSFIAIPSHASPNMVQDLKSTADCGFP